MSLYFWVAIAAAIIVTALVALVVKLADRVQDADPHMTEFDASCERFGYVQDARNRGEL